MVGCAQQPPPSHRPCASALLAWRTLHCPSFGFGVADRSSRWPPPPPGWHIGQPCRRGLLPIPVLVARVGIPDSRPERGHDDRVAGARDGVLLLHEPPDVVPEGFVFLLCDLIKIPLNPR